MLGALIVAILIVGFFVFGGSFGDAEKDANIQTEPPARNGGTLPGQ